MIPSLLLACACPPVWALALGRILRFRPGSASFWSAWGGAALGYVLAAVVDRDVPTLIVAALQILIAAVCWWLSRRKKKRSPKLIGAKSRAILAAVVARMRETAKPRRVLRPVPGGAA